MPLSVARSVKEASTLPLINHEEQDTRARPRRRFGPDKEAKTSIRKVGRVERTGEVGRPPTQPGRINPLHSSGQFTSQHEILSKTP
jgi:hypothetical protein